MMKLKLMPFLVGFFTLTLAIAPLAAQACSGANKDRGNDETSLPEGTSTSATSTEINFFS